MRQRKFLTMIFLVIFVAQLVLIYEMHRAQVYTKNTEKVGYSLQNNPSLSHGAQTQSSGLILAIMI